MAISVRASVAWAIVTADSVITLPTHQAGDRIFVFAAWKAFDTTALISGWTEVTEFADGSVAAGANVGSVKVGCWYKDATSSSETNPTLDWSVSPAPGARCAITLAKGAGDTWDTPLFATAAIAAATNWSATASTTMTVKDGAIVMEVAGFRDDSAAMTRSATTALEDDGSPNVTWNGNVVENPSTHASSTTSNDISADLIHRFVTTGAAGVNLTATGTLSASETGACLWVHQGITAAPTAYELDAQPGAFTLTGSDAGVLANRALDAQPSTFTLTGVDAGLYPGYALIADGPAPNPTLRDDFTSIDQLFSAYSANWTEMQNPDRLVIAGNAVELDTGSIGASAYWNVEAFGPDCDVSAAITLPGGLSSIEVGLELRIDSPGAARNGYRAAVSQGVASLRTLRFYRLDAGTPTLLSPDFLGGFGVWPDGTVLTIRAIGNVFHLYRDGVFLGTRVDSTYPSAGFAGFQMIRVASDSPSMDDFHAGNFSSFSVVGVEAGLFADRAIDAQPGVFTLTGFEADLVHTAIGGAFELDAEPGVFAVTGMDAGLLAGYSIDAQPTTFTITGIAAELLAARVLSADPGTIVLTGADASLTAERLIVAEPGVYVVTGFDAELVFTGLLGEFSLNAEPGVFILTGAEAELLAERVLDAEPGEFIVTGVDATFFLERVLELNAEPGVFTLTGFAAMAELNLEQFPQGGGEDFISILNE